MSFLKSLSSLFIYNSISNQIEQEKKQQATLDLSTELLRELVAFDKFLESHHITGLAPDIDDEEVARLRGRTGVNEEIRRLNDCKQKILEFLRLGGKPECIGDCDDIDKYLSILKYVKSMGCLDRQADYFSWNTLEEVKTFLPMDLDTEFEEKRSDFNSYLHDVGISDYYWGDTDSFESRGRYALDEEMEKIDELKSKIEHFVRLEGDTSCILSCEEIDEYIRILEYVIDMGCIENQSEYLSWHSFEDAKDALQSDLSMEYMEKAIEFNIYLREVGIECVYPVESTSIETGGRAALDEEIEKIDELRTRIEEYLDLGGDAEEIDDFETIEQLIDEL